MAKLSFRHIDGGRGFDFGSAAADYAAYRDIYPRSMYEKLQRFEVVRSGMRVLDVGSGSGALPRLLMDCGADFAATDISEAQIAQAVRLSAGLPIEYAVAHAEHSPFPDRSFDLVTACQCFWYFNIPEFLAELQRILRSGGRFCRIAMMWLPEESAALRASEELVLQFNPDWTGGGFRVADYRFPEWASGIFELELCHAYRETLSFSLDSWCGRMRSCRGVGAALPPDKVAEFDEALRRRLAGFSAALLEMPHYIRIEVFRLATGKNNICKQES